MNKKNIFIILLILVVLGFLGFLYYRNQVFSKEILKLEILGPENAKMGEEIEYTVKYKNNGNFSLTQPQIIFELPEDCITEEEKTRFTQDLEDIYPGDEKFIKFKARLVGKERDLEVSKAWLSYIPKNLTARYESNTTFTTKIDTVPITLDFDLPSKAEKGKEIEYSINYYSNIDYPLDNLSVKIDGMQGFDFESSDPVSLDQSEWKLATLQKAQGGRITVNGRITAGTGTNLPFNAKLGMWRNGQFVVVKEATKEVAVIEPLLFISQQINGSSNYVASPGETLNYKISFRNIGNTPFNDLFMFVRLSSDAFDLSTLESPNGEVRQSDSLVAWDYKTVQDLKLLNPQQEGQVEFSVKLKNNWDVSDAEKNNMVIVDRVDISQISQEFQTKVNSKLEFSQNAYYSEQNGISNSGVMPPIVGQPTTYAITWQVRSVFNDVKNVKVKATLPMGVNLTGRTYPNSEISNFSLDSNSREIVWSVGDLTANSGSRSITFQVSFTPSYTQRGAAGILINDAIVYAEDQFTGTVSEARTAPITTNLTSDPAWVNKGIIQ